LSTCIDDSVLVSKCLDGGKEEKSAVNAEGRHDLLVDPLRAMLAAPDLSL